MKSILGIEGIVAQYGYLEKLCHKKKEILINCFEETAQNLFFGNKIDNDKFLEENVANFPLNENIESLEYYEKVLNLIPEEYKNNLKCMSLASKTYFRIGKIQNQIGFYEKALAKDQIFRNLSRNIDDNKKFYAKNSKIREIYENIASISKKIGNTPKALEFYELRGNHHEIKKIIKELEKDNEENAFLLEKFGDYYKEIGMAEKAIDYYKKASGIILEMPKLAEIMKKIAEALSNSGPQGKKTLEFIEMQMLLEKGLDFLDEKKKIFKDLYI